MITWLFLVLVILRLNRRAISQGFSWKNRTCILAFIALTGSSM